MFELAIKISNNISLTILFFKKMPAKASKWSKYVENDKMESFGSEKKGYTLNPPPAKKNKRQKKKDPFGTRYFRVVAMNDIPRNFGRYKTHGSSGNSALKTASDWFQLNGSSSVSVTLEDLRKRITSIKLRKEYQKRDSPGKEQKKMNISSSKTL